MFYQEFRPSAPLAPYVRCYWLLRASANPFPAPERLIPDGHIELIFNGAGPYRRRRAEGGTPGDLVAGSHLVGERTRGYLIEQVGAIDHVAIRFKAGGLYPFFSVAPAELTDRVVATRDGLGADLASLEARLFEASEDRARVALLDGFLRQRLRPLDRPAALARQAVARIAASRGTAPVAAIAADCGVSCRHLERSFLDVVGMTPKGYSRIARFLAALEHARRADAPGWSAAAYACGYADQAHLIKDFTRFTGLSPTRYAAQPNQIAAMLTSGAPSHSSKTAH